MDLHINCHDKDGQQSARFCGWHCCKGIRAWGELACQPNNHHMVAGHRLLAETHYKTIPFGFVKSITTARYFTHWFILLNISKTIISFLDLTTQDFQKSSF